MHEIIKRNEFPGRMSTVSTLCSAQAIDPTADPLIPFAAVPKREIYLGATLHEPGQNPVKLADGIGFPSIVPMLGTERAGALSLPSLAHSITRLHEQDELALCAARNEHRNRLGLRKAVRYKKSLFAR